MKNDNKQELHGIRKLDPESWKVFTRKAGVMKHRNEKRDKMKLQKELRNW